MDIKINKYKIGIEICLGTQDAPPNSGIHIIPPYNTYWFRFNFGEWKKLKTNIMSFNVDLSKINNKKELISYLENY